MYGKLKDFLTDELRKLEEQKLYKHERIIESAQGAEIVVKGKKCLNFCANNYLGLSSHPELIRAAHEGIDHRGYGLSSVRFICGTQDIHKTLERKVSEFLGMDDTILFSSCFDANGAVFEPLLGEGDAIISDALNHASIIDGVRLCKAQRWAYKHSDMRDVEELDPATGKPRAFRVETPVTENLVERLTAAKVPFSFKSQNPLLLQILSSTVPFLLVFVLIYFLFYRNMASGARGAFSFGKSRARLMSRDTNKVTFKDVAGVD